MSPPEVCATRVTVAVPPGERIPRLHVVVVAGVHVPWLGVAETMESPAGSVSERVTLLAPATLSAVMVKRKLTSVGVPSTRSGSACPVMRRSVVAARIAPPTFAHRADAFREYDIVTDAPVDVSRLETARTSPEERGAEDVAL